MNYGLSMPSLGETKHTYTLLKMPQRNLASITNNASSLLSSSAFDVTVRKVGPSDSRMATTTLKQHRDLDSTHHEHFDSNSEASDPTVEALQNLTVHDRNLSVTEEPTSYRLGFLSLPTELRLPVYDYVLSD